MDKGLELDWETSVLQKIDLDRFRRRSPTHQGKNFITTYIVNEFLKSVELMYTVILWQGGSCHMMCPVM